MALMARGPNSSATLDRDEVARFARLGGEWWDPRGPVQAAPSHQSGAAHLYPRPALPTFGRDPKQASSLQGLSVLDIGCGGGLVCEPLARLGARVTGIDPGRETIEAAKAHASAAGLDIDYRGGDRRGACRPGREL